LFGKKAFLAIIAGLLGASANAQPVFPPICTGLKSIDWCHQFGPGLPASMTVDASGITYVASSSGLTAVLPDGQVIFNAQFNAAITFIAPAGNGTMWVVADALFQVDGQGRVSPIGYDISGGNPVTAISSDAAGNLYFRGATPSGSVRIVELNAAGAVTGMFPIDSYKTQWQ